ncbi:MAG TPA: C39 family peptidase [Haloferula sp.]
MKRMLLSLLLVGVLPGIALALPNSITGPVFNAQSPLNGKDLTADLMAPGIWDGSAELPGEWTDEGRVASSEISYLMARPKLFGHEVILLRSVKRDGKLESLEATFVDAGSFFGYFDEELPEGLSKRETRKEVEVRMAAKQTEFTKIYTDAHTELRTAISASCGETKPIEAKIGRTRGLKMPVEEWKKEGKHVRLLAANNRLLRVSIAAGESDEWLDPSVAALPEREQLAKLAASVTKADDGTVGLPDLQPIPQGYRPYCGLNSLAMAARHFGLHLDEDWLAVAAGFQNTGRADGANLVKVYHAVASEAGLGLDRTSKFDASVAAQAISQGFPVIVWRRFSFERNQLHSQFMRKLSRDSSATLPDPGNAGERGTWPGESAPLHASVVVGYNPERKEVLFLESWTGRDKPRRMRVEELAATTYLCFVFKP